MDVFTTVTRVIATLVTVASTHGDTSVQCAAMCQSGGNTSCRNTVYHLQLSIKTSYIYTEPYLQDTFMHA